MCWSKKKKQAEGQNTEYPQYNKARGKSKNKDQHRSGNNSRELTKWISKNLQYDSELDCPYIVNKQDVISELNVIMEQEVAVSTQGHNASAVVEAFWHKLMSHPYSHHISLQTGLKFTREICFYL